MVRQVKAKKPEYLFGKGKVTPTQIAYVVDQYLSEHQFTQTRSSFRSEASSLISKTPVQEGPKMMSLETIIDEYVKMKEQKLIVEMEKQRLEQESSRVNSLLHGMQSVMNAYNAAGAAAASVPALAAAAPFTLSDQSVAVVQHSDLTNASPAGRIVNVSPNTTPPWVPPNMLQASTSFTTPVDGNPCSKKRRGSEVVPGAPINAKKSRARMPNKKVIGGQYFFITPYGICLIFH
uniref:Uncharacterized protein n=1 Tax=Kalanchoe fedtschenkoi TaxID=63787 RepID=A0A7N0SX57_KALFE